MSARMVRQFMHLNIASRKKAQLCAALVRRIVIEIGDKSPALACVTPDPGEALSLVDTINFD